MSKIRLHALALAVAAVGCSSDARPDNTGQTVPSAQPEATGGAGSGTTQIAPSNSVTAAATNSGTAGAATSARATAPGAAAPGVGNASPAAAPSAQTDTMAAMAAGDPPPATGGPITENCRGFSFTGLVYSPGGDVLPNKCEAFHPTLNNPFAVRCVDAWPWYKTEFPGDNYCILPPQPGMGVQFGHHPQGEGDAWFKAVSQGDMSGYQSPASDWTLSSGEEEERNISIKHDNAAGKFYRLYSRMRGGSHHMIVSVNPNSPQTFVWGPGNASGLFSGQGLPTVQRPDDNDPQSLSVPHDDAGLYREVVANATLEYNMHHFNVTDRTILKEAWQNMWLAEGPTTPIKEIVGLPLLQSSSTFANPGEIVDMHYVTTIPAPLRVLGLYGHRHAWTTNFTAWVERPGSAKTEILYQSFDWFDELTFTYNSQVKNPLPASGLQTDGGHTGLLMLSQGDQLHFNCHIEYTDARAHDENSPVTPAQNGPLRFANEAYNAEMCILFGHALGDVGTFEQLTQPPPAFAQ